MKHGESKKDRLKERDLRETSRQKNEAVRDTDRDR